MNAKEKALKKDLISIFLIISCVLGFGYCLMNVDPEPVNPKQYPVEYNLTMLDKGDLSPNSAEILRNKYLLTELQRLSGESQERIAEIVFNGQKVLLNQYGRKIKMNQIMEKVIDSYSIFTSQNSLPERTTLVVLAMGE